MYEFQILSANTPGVSDTWRSRERHWLDTGYLTIKSPEFKKTDISKTDNQRNQVQGSERKIRRVKMDFEGQSKKKIKNKRMPRCHENIFGRRMQ